MATQIPRELYPLSTRSGDAIPMDIIKPEKVVILDVAPNSVTAHTFAEDNKILVLYATVDTVLSFSGASMVAPVPEGTYLTDAIFIPAFTIITCESIAGSGKIVSLVDTGTLVIQVVEKWAALAVPKQAVVR